MILEVTDTGLVELKVDPTIVMASRQHVADQLAAEKHSVIKGVWYPATSAAIADHGAASGPNYDAGNLKKVLDQAGVKPCTINIPGDIVIATDMNIPANKILDMRPGRTIVVDGCTLTINGAISADIRDDIFELRNGGAVAGDYYFIDRPEVPTIAALRKMRGTARQTVQPAGYHVPGDGGGGPPRRWTEGAAPGTYVDTLGDVIVPEGGDGSEAWLIPKDATIGWLMFGAKGTGDVADAAANAVAIQAADRAAASRKYEPEAGKYYVDRPLKIGSYRNMCCQGTGTSQSHGVILIADPAATWPDDRGVLETNNFTWPEDFPEGSTKPDYWATASVVNLTVDANNVADYGVVIWCPNEQALLRRVSAFRAKKDNFFFGGYMSVLQVEDCSVWHAGRYGVAMQNHPDPDFAPGVSSAGGGRGSGGSIRFYGISGDANAAAHIYANGSQIVELSGLKSELNVPNTIVIDGDRILSARQRWSITGFRAEAGVEAIEKNFIKIIGTAKPQIYIGPGATYNYTNLINDTVEGRIVPNGDDGGRAVVYDPTYEHRHFGRALNMTGPLKIAGTNFARNTWIELVAHKDTDPDTARAYQQRFKTTYAEEGIYEWQRLSPYSAVKI